MEMLQYFIMLILSYSGVFFGFLLKKIAKEEYQQYKHLQFLKKEIFSYIYPLMGLLFYSASINEAYLLAATIFIFMLGLFPKLKLKYTVAYPIIAAVLYLIMIIV